MQARRKKRATTLGLGCLVVAGVVFGYLEVFTKGIDRLPARPCDGAVDRETAARALPSARSAEERGKLRRGRGNYFFACYVRTSGGSVISGEVQPGDASPSGWRASYTSDGKVSEVSVGDVKALTLEDSSAVYVPCTPPGETPGEAQQTYVLTVDARTIGETRVRGNELRQVLADFAYRLARHTYRAVECQEARTFPDDLPRLPAA
ncbi:hypothetical protein OHA27_13580 [Streptomyces sp. NBC_01619]|uniref:hypothetical protein n=1 Tax=Streptomyces sp. NBC_01619 TaxID=2975901 RepID=UPI002257FA74|nr:hypothetical protein [Streptomyces sp. NBC_01619]MCX4511319.1 hypothetical protein [Streptomyces sp. NBC_01619]